MIIIDTVGELFENFDCYPDSITVFDAKDNTEDTYYGIVDVENIIEEYGNRELIQFTISHYEHFEDFHIYIKVK